MTDSPLKRLQDSLEEQDDIMEEHTVLVLRDGSRANPGDEDALLVQLTILDDRRVAGVWLGNRRSDKAIPEVDPDDLEVAMFLTDDQVETLYRLLTEWGFGKSP